MKCAGQIPSPATPVILNEALTKLYGGRGVTIG
jgi:hypothetical protein